MALARIRSLEQLRYWPAAGVRLRWTGSLREPNRSYGRAATSGRKCESGTARRDMLLVSIQEILNSPYRPDVTIIEALQFRVRSFVR